MYIFLTSFRAIEQETGELKTYGGPNLPAISWAMAEAWCKRFAPHLKVEGLLVAEIPCKEGRIHDACTENIIEYITYN